MAWEVLDIFQFEPNAFRPLLEAESRVWHDDLCWDFSASAELIAKCLEECRLSGYALVIENHLRGYCLFFCDGDKGLIGDLFVEPQAAEMGQVRDLLERSVDHLVETPRLRRIEAQLPHFTFDQLEPSFRVRSFNGYRRRFMTLALDSVTSRADHGGKGRDEAVAGPPPDFELFPWERKHDREAAQLLFRTYCQHVDTAINDQYGSVEGASRLLENIVRHGGCGEYLPYASLVAIHRLTRTLGGVLAVTAVGSDGAHIPQLAVAAQFQGIGLGTAMLKLAFQGLRKQGRRKVSLTVTELNTGAVRLYERLGFTTSRLFGAFVWDSPRRPDRLAAASAAP